MWVGEGWGEKNEGGTSRRGKREGRVAKHNEKKADIALGANSEERI